MNIVQLVLSGDGAITNHVNRLSRQLRLLGEDVLVAADAETIADYQLGETLTLPQRLSGTHLRIARRTLKSADVVHAHGQQAGHLAATLITGRHRPVFVITWHNPAPDMRSPGAAAYKAHNLGARFADAVCGTSMDLVELARKAGAKESWITTVPSPNVPDLLAREPLSNDDKAQLREKLFHDLPADAFPGATPDPTLPMVLTIGSLIARKNINTALTAAEHLRGQATWVVLGKGDMAVGDRLRSQASSTAAPFVMAGARLDVPDWLAAADVFALTSSWEGRPLAVQEAMAARVPIVASRVGGLPDLVGDGGGILVDLDDTEGYANAVRELLTNDALRESMITTGYDRMVAQPNTRDVAVIWRDHYMRLMQQREAGGA